MKFFPPRPETAVRGQGGMGSAKPGDTAVVDFGVKYLVPD